MAKDLAIILNNGSINSAVVTALAAQKYRPITLFAEAAADPVSNSKHAYDMQVAHFRPYREHTMSMPFLASLSERAASPAAPADPRLTIQLGPHLTKLLPIVAAAAGFAAFYQAAAVYIGLRVGPHNDELSQVMEFTQIWNELLQQPCGHGELEVYTPLVELEPWQVIDLGFQLGVPFERTWSCSDETADACWACTRCRAREAAFQQAGKADPLRLVKKSG